MFSKIVWIIVLLFTARNTPPMLSYCSFFSIHKFVETLLAATHYGTNDKNLSSQDNSVYNFNTLYRVLISEKKTEKIVTWVI